jgi:hypothetical protein
LGETISKLDTKLTEADAKLAELVDSMEQEGKVFSKEVLEQLRSLRENTVKLAADDVTLFNKIESSTSKLGSVTTSLSSVIEEVKQRHITDQAKILSDFATLEEVKAE